MREERMVFRPGMYIPCDHPSQIDSWLRESPNVLTILEVAHGLRPVEDLQDTILVRFKDA